MTRLTQKTFSSLILMALITCSSIIGKDIEPLKCGPPPDTSEIHRFLASSPIVLHARIQEMIPVKEGQKFDLIALITQIVIKPDNMDIPKRVMLRRFFLPSNESSSNPYLDKVGCLEVFKPYTKYTFLLGDTGETIIHRGNELTVLALSGPTLTFSEKVNQDIQQFLCKSCCKLIFHVLMYLSMIPNHNALFKSTDVLIPLYISICITEKLIYLHNCIISHFNIS